MLIRGSNNFYTYDINNKKADLKDGSLRLINMESVQMIQGIKDGNSYFLVAYVNTGRSNYGPIGVNITHPASFEIDTRPMEAMEDITSNMVKETGNSGTGYYLALTKTSTNENRDQFYRSRDTNNIYFTRRFIGIFQRNAASFFKAMIANFNKFLTSAFSWNWLTTGKNGSGNVTSRAKALMFNKLDDDNRYNKYIGVNGIEMIKLAYYSSRQSIVVEFNKIQREYSKYIRGTLACFEPPKVYQLSANKFKSSDINSGNPTDKTSGASFRYTTEIYVANNRLIADPGLYIDKNVWLRSGLDYDIDFPIYRTNQTSYKLIYRFKGQYIGLGTKSVLIHYTPSRN